MSKPTPLTDRRIQGLKPGPRLYRVTDGGHPGLVLEIRPNGRKFWRMRYVYAGNEQMLALGQYPAVPLALARERWQEARARLARGIKPIRGTLDAQGGHAFTFAQLADDWLKTRAGVLSPKRAAWIQRAIQLHLLPPMGQKPVQCITPQDLLAVVNGLQDAGKRATAGLVLGIADRAFDYALQTGLITANPARTLKGCVLPPNVQHRAAITDPAEIGQLLAACRAYTCGLCTHSALLLAPLLMLRPLELVRLEWRHVNLETAEICLPVEHMKCRRTKKEANKGQLAHVVPLPRQAVAVFQELKRYTGKGRFCLPADGNPESRKPITTRGLRTALKALGYAGRMTVHGFRAMASTRLHELGYPSHIVERQLAHVDKNAVRAAYNHADYLEERRAMLQDWADWLDVQRAKASEEATKEANE